MVRTTGQVLHVLLRSPNGFIPSVLSVNLMFLGSLPNSGKAASKSLSTKYGWQSTEGGTHDGRLVGGGTRDDDLDVDTR
jgi:hypothetical protein